MASWLSVVVAVAGAVAAVSGSGYGAGVGFAALRRLVSAPGPRRVVARLPGVLELLDLG